MDISAIASSQTAPSSGLSQLTQDFDSFLTLLTTQLQNQDPLDPLDTEKFTEQLVQFASVEQSIQTNQHLEALIALQAASANETALSMVGRIASVESDIATLTDDAARWTYSLPADAAAVSLIVLNAAGAPIAALEGSAKAGAHDVNWSGAMNSGERAPQGAYRLVAEAVGADGAPIDVSIASRGLVNAVAFNAGAPEIEIAGQRFALDLVSRVDASF